MVDAARFVDSATREFRYVANSDQDLFDYIETLSTPRKTGLYNTYFYALQQLAERYKSEPEVMDRLTLALVRYWLDSWDNEEALRIVESNAGAFERLNGHIDVKSTLRFLRKQQAIAADVSLSTFPRATARFSDLGATIRKHLIGNLKVEAIIRPETRLFSKGSCFAENILTMLADLMTRPPCYVPEAEERTAFDLAYSIMSYGEGRVDAFWDDLRDADSPVFIFTLGVSEGFFDDQGRYVGNSQFRGNIARAKEFRFRSFSVEENAAQLEDGIRRIQALNKACKIVVTLSPVPLEGSFRPRSSSMMSDCTNKAIGRATIDVVMQKAIDNLYYFPSFEMVRWMAPYYGRSPFGADDGHPRHVNAALVKLICIAFLEYFAAPEIYEQARAKLGSIEDLI